MKAKVFLLLFACLFYSCSDEVQIEDDRRMQISGKINSSEPAEISVVAFGTREIDPPTNPDKILGFSKSDNSGNFSFTSLDTESHNLLIAINPETLESYNENKGSYYFYDDTGKHQLSYNFQQINLPANIEFEFNIENTSGSTDTLYYSFKYEKTVRYFQKTTNGFEEVEDNTHYVPVNQMLPLSEPRVHQIRLAGNSDLRFIYHFNDEAAQEITVNVNPETSSYDFEY